MSALIGKALLYGYTPRVILNKISRQFPKAANAIYAAQAAGYTADTILQAISDPKKKNKANADDYLTEHEKIKKRGKKRQKRSALTALGALGTAGAVGTGLYALSQAGKAIQPSAVLPAIRGQVQGRQGTTINIPNPRLGNQQGQVPGNGAPPQISFNPLNNPPNNPPPQSPRGPNKPNGPIRPTPQSQGPKAAPQVGMPPVKIDPQQSVNLVKNLKEDNKFNTVLQGGHDPATAALILQKLLPKEKVALLEKVEGGLEKVVEDYGMFLQSQKQQKQQPQEQQQPQSILQEMMGQKQQEPQQSPPTPGIDVQEDMIAPQFRAKQPQEMQGLQEQQEQSIEQSLPEGIELPPITQPQPVKKAEHKPLDIDFKKLVITPHGVGEIKHEGKKGIIAKVNGKDKSFFPNEIEKPSQDVIEAVSNILQIPEEDRSSNVALFTYDPDEEKMFIQYHNGESYKYLHVSREKMMRIANKLHIPITEGKNIFGAWSPEDKESLGAALFQEILSDPLYKKPKKGEPPNPNYVKLDTMYDYWKKLRKQPKRKT
jgi:hypothetical protein